ncbi:hypothetical protein JR316_0000878 [Psilocybe cubensis]|uniref:Uncharacterized protein n=1 Tax=Psilocybe cubensis TaxID=181762 RepID=A0ACB8HFM7_PSICU|nr:hypothetical protein JR316_0000878 [Psilocybe cubensis]KAH9486813.1 hypothetical protein JR316_0000878 [Psilocybe cubensis]
MSTSSRIPPPSLPSTTSLNHNTSLRSFHRPPPPITTVVTSPRALFSLLCSPAVAHHHLAWARDEPPSPKEVPSDTQGAQNHTESHAHVSDTASFQSGPAEGTSRWWTFTLPRTRQEAFNLLPPPPRLDRKSFRDISLSWMPASATQREGSTFLRKDKEKEKEHATEPMSISMPPPSMPYTMAHANTPGWDTPWSARAAAQGPSRRSRDDASSDYEEDEHSDTSPKDLKGWALRRKRIRSFILVNTYVPLLFRFINIAFTTAALGMAIQIRKIEFNHSAAGAVGSSPTVVIIFAPLTLIHVMAAIYVCLSPLSSRSSLNKPYHRSLNTLVDHWVCGGRLPNLPIHYLRSSSSAPGLLPYHYVSITSLLPLSHVPQNQRRLGTISYLGPRKTFQALTAA